MAFLKPINTNDTTPPETPTLQNVTDEGAATTNSLTVGGLLADVNSDNGQHVVLDYRGVTLENGGTFSGDGSNLTNLPIPTLQSVTDQSASTTNNLTIANGSPVLTLDGEGHTPFTFHVDGGGLYIGGDQLMIYANEEIGYVGIGKNNPTSELDVDGIVTADSFIGDGSQLTNLHIPTLEQVVTSDEDANLTNSPISTGGLSSNGAVVIFDGNPLVLYDDGNAHELSLTGNNQKIVASNTISAPSFEGEIAASNISGVIANSNTTASTTHSFNTIVARDGGGAVGGLRIKDISNTGSLIDFRSNSNGVIGNVTYNSGTGLSTINIDQFAGATTTAIFYGDGSNLSGLSTSNIVGTLPLSKGGTGSTTKNFVDLTNDQTVAGVKTFSNEIVQTPIANPASPSNGTVWVSSDNHALATRIDGTTLYPAYRIFTWKTGNSSNSSSEINLMTVSGVTTNGTYSLPAGLMKVGKKLRLNAVGTINTQASTPGTLNIKFYIGATAISLTTGTLPTSLSAAGMRIEAEFIVTSFSSPNYSLDGMVFCEFYNAGAVTKYSAIISGVTATFDAGTTDIVISRQYTNSLNALFIRSGSIEILN